MHDEKPSTIAYDASHSLCTRAGDQLEQTAEEKFDGCSQEEGAGKEVASEESTRQEGSREEGCGTQDRSSRRAGSSCACGQGC
ncbi:MAG: hypothetical protein VX766_13060 [Pseudomonadota bacterium]|nr:hypothetical protein [Pseudomonadota bacterium]